MTLTVGPAASIVPSLLTSHDTLGLAPAEVVAVKIVGAPATGVAGEVVKATAGTELFTQALISGLPSRA